MKAAIIGGGVIGGGWAARFLLNGWDVRVFDPDPQAERKVGEVLTNARHPYTAGLMASTPLASQGQRRLRQIPGSMPRLGALPSGCPFHPRCDRAQDACRVDPGPSIEACDGRAACWFPITDRQEVPA